jgi:hypothetical protein
MTAEKSLAVYQADSLSIAEFNIFARQQPLMRETSPADR